jgi:hypothetical protein
MEGGRLKVQGYLKFSFYNTIIPTLNVEPGTWNTGYIMSLLGNDSKVTF